MQLLRIFVALGSLAIVYAKTNSFSFGGNNITIWYAPDMDAYVFNVDVLEGAYFAIGYGHSMIDTDMVYWGCINTTAFNQKDMWGYAHTVPIIETYNTYNTTMVFNDTSKACQFQSFR